MAYLNFVTMGDEKFFDSILLSMQQAQKFYPESHFYIYDWGFTREQVVELSQGIDNVHIIDWKSSFNCVRAVRVLALQYWFKQLIKKYLLLNSRLKGSLYEKTSKFRKHEYLMVQKPFIILDCVKRCQGKLIFLDGDAFLINKIDELLSVEFDVGLTLRRKHEIHNEKNKCQVLNAGVLFFMGAHEKTEAFLKQWIRTMIHTYEYLIEQTALTRMTEKDNPTIYNDYYNTGIVIVDGLSIKVKVLPCESYNFNWIEEGVDKKKNKIVHFKSGRHTKKQFNKLLKTLDI